MRNMKTIGDRIRQARVAKGMSALNLAVRVGYKTQSGISNLENKATGTGGHKIKEIARELDVSVDWLLAGPDSEIVPFLSRAWPRQEYGPRPPEINDGAGGLYLERPGEVWPFSLFNLAGWMALAPKDREDFENLIAGAVLRAQKIRA